MYLTNEAVFLFLWYLTLAISGALILVPFFWRRAKPLVVLLGLNLAAGAVHFISIQVDEIRENVFLNANPDHPDFVFPGRSLHIVAPGTFSIASLGCGTSDGCEFAGAERIFDGTLDVLELGTDPILRYELAVHEPDCFNAPWRKWGIGDRILSAGLGICALEREVEDAQSAYVFHSEYRRIFRGSGRFYVHAWLTPRNSDEVLAAFDGWHTNSLYEESSSNARRGPGPLISALFKPAEDHTNYDPRPEFALLDRHGFNDAAMQAAMGSERQMVRSHAFWFACTTRVRPLVSDETAAIISNAASGLFENRPDLTYPAGCPNWLP